MKSENIDCEKENSENHTVFEMNVDPFFSENNMKHLRRGILALNADKGVEHELVDE